MQHDPQDAIPTTHHEPDDVEAHGLSGKKVPPAAEDVAAHIWAGKPPVVDDVQAHISVREPAEADEDGEDVEGHSRRRLSQSDDQA